jgi:hypothetical protein
MAIKLLYLLLLQLYICSSSFVVVFAAHPRSQSRIRAERLPNAIVHRAAVKRQHKSTAVAVEHDR